MPLAAYGHALKRRRLLVLASGLFGILAALAILWLIPAQYTVQMMVAPMPKNSAAGGARMALVSAAPVAMTEQSDSEELSDYARMLFLLRSSMVASKLAADPALMQQIFSAEWDSGAQNWRPSTAPKAIVQRVVLQMMGRTPWQAPDSRRLADWLDKSISVQQHGITSMRQITLRHRDPQFAKAVLLRVWQTADGILREAALGRTQAEIQYIQDLLVTERLQDARDGSGGTVGAPRASGAWHSWIYHLLQKLSNSPPVHNCPIGRTLG